MKANAQQVAENIARILESQQAEAFARLQSELQSLSAEFSRKTFFYLFAISPRWFKHEEAQINPELEKLDVYGAMSGWLYPQFARLYILIMVERELEHKEFSDAVNQLFDTAEVNELILLVQSLQFIPSSQRFVARAREAARTNIASVFSALAHRSDYAFHYFDDEGWNQLILKAAFLAEPIWSIYGLRERNNPKLVVMLLNYVDERQAASRIVPWDLWACPAWSASNENELNYLQNQFSKLDLQSRGAILLALRENDSAAAQEKAKELAAGAHDLDLENLSWSAIASLPIEAEAS